MFFFTQNTSAIVNKMANFCSSNFAFSAVSNSALQKNHGAINCVYYVMVVDFNKRCHVLLNRVVESLLCSLLEHTVLLCKDYLLESQYCREFHSQCRAKTKHLNTHQ